MPSSKLRASITTMFTVPILIGSLFAMIAAAIHVVIFVLESFRWNLPQTWRMFGIRSQEDASRTEFLAYNQGFYNLFLAIGAALGALFHFENTVAAFTLTLFSCSSMVLAAVVLVTASRSSLRPALIQGVPPLVAVISTVVAILALP